MKISTEFPPNYDHIVKAFPAVKHNKRIVFTYGDTIYMPGQKPEDMTQDLLVHEHTHIDQQTAFNSKEISLGIPLDQCAAMWWDRYVVDREFRIEQELEAYGNQYAFVLRQKDTSNGDKRRFLKHIATDLASEIYGGWQDVHQTMMRIELRARSSVLSNSAVTSASDAA